MEMKIQTNDQGSTIFIEGKLTFKDHPAFNQHMDDLNGRGASVVFDLSRLEMIDSAGIGMLFLAQKLVEKNGGAMLIKNPRGQVKRIFDITGIGQQIKVVGE